MIKVFVFGNQDLKEDNLPIRILPELRKIFPNIEFEVKDPNEELGDVYTDVITLVITVIDTVIGIKDVEVFDDLEKFAAAPRVGMHDFDALTNLRYLQKLGKIKKVRVIGVPQEMDEKKAIKKISAALR